MKSLLLILSACLALSFLLPSCSPHIRAQGLTETDSSYVITNKGKRIDASEVKIKGGYVVTDGVKYDMNDIAAVKSKAEYTVLQDGVKYNCIIYGKINLLSTTTLAYSYQVPTAGMPGSGGYSSYRPSSNFFLNRKNSQYMDKLTFQNLIDYTEDNPDALRKARAAKIWGIVSYGTAVTSIGGITAAVLLRDKPTKVGSALGYVGLFSIPVFFISMPISNHKMVKAVKIYNQ